MTATINDTMYLEYEQTVLDQLLDEENLNPSWVGKAKEFLRDFWVFTWSRGEDLKGEFDLAVDNQGDLALELKVWALDNDDEQDDKMQCLTVTSGASTYKPARDQMRELIHYFLCHEADEQMWFGADRPFHPHHFERVWPPTVMG